MLFLCTQAVSNSHKDVAEHLMEKTDRSVLRLTDRQGRTALHYAAGLAHDADASGGDEEEGDVQVGPIGRRKQHVNVHSYSVFAHMQDMYKWLLQFGPDEKQADGVSRGPIRGTLRFHSSLWRTKKDRNSLERSFSEFCLRLKREISEA